MIMTITTIVVTMTLKKTCRCKGQCNLDHSECSRGILPYSLVHCDTTYTALTGSYLNFVSFEKRNVETYNKGKPYSTIEKVETPMDYLQFMQKLRLFSVHSFIKMTGETPEVRSDKRKPREDRQTVTDSHRQSQTVTDSHQGP